MQHERKRTILRAANRALPRVKRDSVVNVRPSKGIINTMRHSGGFLFGNGFEALAGKIPERVSMMEPPPRRQDHKSKIPEKKHDIPYRRSLKHKTTQNYRIDYCTF